MNKGIILYGPPAAGKDSVTRELLALDDRFEHYRRLKSGPGRSIGYHLVDEIQFAQLELHGEILYSNERYGAKYGVDRRGLDAITTDGAVPIVHLGQMDGVSAVAQGYPLRWTIVGLWCSRKEAEKRLHSRLSSDIPERLEVWDATLRDMTESDPSTFTIVLNTEEFEPPEAASIILACLTLG